MHGNVLNELNTSSTDLRKIYVLNFLEIDAGIFVNWDTSEHVRKHVEWLTIYNESRGNKAIVHVDAAFVQVLDGKWCRRHACPWAIIIAVVIRTF